MIEALPPYGEEPLVLRPSPQADPQVAREAFGLPLLFLTIGLAGGLRVGQVTGMRFVPPSQICLILALLLIAVLVRGGGLAPERLMSGRRTGLANLSGLVVLATLLFATAQMFNTLTPERGLLHLVFNLVFLILLSTTMAARPDPTHLLRTVMVMFGSAFASKYIVLSALYDPEGGLLKRVLTTLLEGLTLGAIDFVPDASVTGYLAMAALFAYLLGVYLLPRRDLVARQSEVLQLAAEDMHAVERRQP